MNLSGSICPRQLLAAQHFNERRQRAVEGIGDGAEQFGFAVRHLAVGGDGFAAGHQDISPERFVIACQFRQRGVHLGQIPFGAREELRLGARRVEKFRARGKSFARVVFIFTADVRERRKEKRAFRQQVLHGP